MGENFWTSFDCIDCSALLEGRLSQVGWRKPGLHQSRPSLPFPSTACAFYVWSRLFACVLFLIFGMYEKLPLSCGPPLGLLPCSNFFLFGINCQLCPFTNIAKLDEWKSISKQQWFRSVMAILAFGSGCNKVFREIVSQPPFADWDCGIVSAAFCEIVSQPLFCRMIERLCDWLWKWMCCKSMIKGASRKKEV